MNYYEVMIASNATALNETLTYESEDDLSVGQVVRVALRKRELSGIVIKKVKKPKYKTKAITEVVNGILLAPELLTLAEMVSSYYGAPRSACYGALIPRGVHINRRSATEKSLEPTPDTSLPVLTEDQDSAIRKVLSTDSKQTIILHGETGSGKTRVYIELALAMRKRGLGSIILVPEIGLTTQLVQEFSAIFNDVFIQHSGQTERERHLQWLQILQHPSPIVVGPRSAIFAPASAGLIVVDESHEQTYKQDQTPKYNALRVARMRANLQNAKLILGSATPAIEDYFVAVERQTPILRMAKISAKEQSKVTTHVVDMTTLENRGKPISELLEDSIADSLSRGFQSLVFHNRRGTSTSILCESCGYVYECPDCKLPLTHHHDDARLRCHVCGYQEKISSFCKQCSEPALNFKGFGTKQLEARLTKLFPTAKIARFDSDNLKNESLNKKYTQLRNSEVDIIVGTQMIAKGLDLPKLETVGVASVDGLVYLPDYSSSQRFFQLIYQVMGRVGRHRPGRVVLQAYDTKNPVLEFAIEKDYGGFFDNEINTRKISKYPPFWFLLSLTTTRKSVDSAKNSAEKLAASIRDNFADIVVLGPTPAFHEKSRSGYKWQLVVKSKNRNDLLAIARGLGANWHFDIDPISLLN